MLAVEGNTPLAVLADQRQRQEFFLDTVAIGDAHDDLKTAKSRLDEIIAEHAKSQILTTGYTLYQVKDSSDYSEFKLLYESPRIASLDANIVVNASISLNHDTDDPNEDTIRDYSGSLSFETEFENVLSSGLMKESKAPITWSINASLTRFEPANRTIGVVQTKFSMPIAVGFRLPLSLSYTSGTPTSSNSEFRVSIGTNVNTDQLAALLNLVGLD